MSHAERLDMIQLLVFITGRPEVFYTHMTDAQLKDEHARLSSPDRLLGKKK